MRTALATLLRADATTIESTISLVDDQLFPEELAHLEHAAARRRAEFGTARVCARRALVAMGVAPRALVPSADRAPVWPRGWVGSIAHTGDYCAVVVHRSPPVVSVGIDAEMLRPLDSKVTDSILDPSERAWIAARAREHADRAEHLSLLVFSAKEAFYKCQYPLSKTVLEFHDVHVDVDIAACRFEARALRAGLPACVGRLEGRYAFDQGMVLCAVELVDESEEWVARV